jgi:coenzyme F420 hydrogenase subunit beta
MSEAMTAPSLARILSGNLCTGCGLCAAISGESVQMIMSDDGYLRPRQSAPLAPETDRLIGDVCPGIRLSQESREGTDHPLWGPIIAVRTGASTDAALRHHASSGGALSALLLYLLESGTADYVVQIAASPDSPIENTLVQSTGRDDVYRAAGSRYAPSAPLADLDRYLAQPGRFALVGKPCDIAAVRALARHDPRVAEKIPVLLSFFCAGIPSKRGTRRILDKLGVAEAEVASFRYRGDGWPGPATATLRDGRAANMSYAESWGDILSRHVQFRCKICPDGSGGFADIVCADAWYSDEAGYPLFEEEDGRSLIVSRTAHGEDLVQRAIAAGFVTAGETAVAEIEKMQPSQARRKRLVVSRLLAMALLGRGRPRFEGLHLARAALLGGVLPNLRSFLGMARRLFRAR